MNCGHNGLNSLSAFQNFSRIPESQLPVLHSGSDHAFSSVRIGGSPGNPIESENWAENCWITDSEPCQKVPYREVVVIAAFGPLCPSLPMSNSFLLRKLGSQISSWLSLLNDASSAPATVPVARRGRGNVGDHANVDVRWISFNFMVQWCEVIEVAEIRNFGHVASSRSLAAGPKQSYGILYMRRVPTKQLN
jgi:hypothetical protein